MYKNKKVKFTERSKRFETEANINKITTKTSRSKDRRQQQSPNSMKNIKIRCKSKDELDELYKEHWTKVTQKYEKLIKKNPKINYEKDRNIELKRCEVCSDFNNENAFMLCEICEDGYHNYCLNSLISRSSDSFICPRCKEQMPSPKKFKQSTLNDEKFNITIKKRSKVIYKILTMTFFLILEM